MKKKSKTYTVMVEVKLCTDAEICAESLEEALQKARQYQIHDIISFEGGHNDSEVKIVGIYE